MAKGQKVKQEIINKILNTFEGAFLYNNDKEVRINGTEDGELVQIKLTFTASKTIVEPDGEEVVPVGNISNSNNAFDLSELTVKDTITVPTEEEKENVKNLLKSLGL